ncbi:hypothetical protein V8F20_007522 [Naviculisporaceae sp. PSN 640]
MGWGFSFVKFFRHHVAYFVIHFIPFVGWCRALTEAVAITRLRLDEIARIKVALFLYETGFQLRYQTQQVNESRSMVS